MFTGNIVLLPTYATPIEHIAVKPAPPTIKLHRHLIQPISKSHRWSSERAAARYSRSSSASRYNLHGLSLRRTPQDSRPSDTSITPNAAAGSSMQCGITDQPTSSIQETKSYLTTAEETQPTLIRQDVIGDGNCFYAAVAFYLTRGETVEAMRMMIADHMQEHRDFYRDFITLRPCETIEDYIRRIRETRAWAGNTEIHILTRILRRVIVTIGPDGQIINLDQVKADIGTYHDTPIFIYYNGVNHFDALLLPPERDSAEELLKELLSSAAPRVTIKQPSEFTIPAKKQESVQESITIEDITKSFYNEELLSPKVTEEIEELIKNVLSGDKEAAEKTAKAGGFLELAAKYLRKGYKLDPNIIKAINQSVLTMIKELLKSGIQNISEEQHYNIQKIAELFYWPCVSRDLSKDEEVKTFIFSMLLDSEGMLVGEVVPQLALLMVVYRDELEQDNRKAFDILLNKLLLDESYSIKIRLNIARVMLIKMIELGSSGYELLWSWLRKGEVHPDDGALLAAYMLSLRNVASVTDSGDLARGLIRNPKVHPDTQALLAVRMLVRNIALGEGGEDLARDLIRNANVTPNAQALLATHMLGRNIALEDGGDVLARDLIRNANVHPTHQAHLAAEMLGRNITLGAGGEDLVRGWIRNANVRPSDRAFLAANMLERNIALGEGGEDLARGWIRNANVPPDVQARLAANMRL